MIEALALCLSLAAGVVVAADDPSNDASEDAATFTNPVAESGADPWVIRDGDTYHYCFSRDDAIWVASSPSLLDVFSAEPVEVWRPEPGRPYSRELWAPELHRLDGAWWIYVAADDGRNENHRMQVLKRDAATPDGRFERVGELKLPGDKWAIDGTALEVDGELYHVWSGWPGDENVAQFLYICKMSDPATPVGERVVLSKPEFDWELGGSGGDLPTINEGPTALRHGDRTFILYSASGSWSDFYCVALLELVGDDPLDPAAWKKYEQPWFQSGNGVVAPGHASVTTTPRRSAIVARLSQRETSRCRLEPTGEHAAVRVRRQRHADHWRTDQPADADPVAARGEVSVTASRASIRNRAPGGLCRSTTACRGRRRGVFRRRETPRRATPCSTFSSSCRRWR